MTITREHQTATQQILDLILDECRYWQGRDETRRGSFAILYAAAKKIADQAQAAPVAEPVAPYAFEYGKDNGDGSYSVTITRGAIPSYLKPVKDWPVKALYTHPHDAELVELLREVMLCAVKLEPISHQLIDRIDAALAGSKEGE
jgi:hypothetical protein